VIQLKIDSDLIWICKAIVEKTAKHGRDVWVWNEDEFQRGYFSGGYCPDEDGHGGADHGEGFYFSYYAPNGGDYIFYLSFDDAARIALGEQLSPKLEYWKTSPLGPY
jgi:hypothetical protein